MAADDALFPITERRCSTCGEVRPLAMFYVASEERRGAKRGGRALASCRLCVRERLWKRRAPRVAILDKIKTEAGCADCGLKDTEHPEIYDFDHLPGFEKATQVSSLLTKGTIENMLAEVAKCEVVCANCHRIRTRRLRESNSFGRDRGAEPDRRTFGRG